jgi:hypothetical protein
MKKYYPSKNTTLVQKYQLGKSFSNFQAFPSLEKQISNMRGFLPLLNGLLDAANLLKYVQHVRRYFCALINYTDQLKVEPTRQVAFTCRFHQTRHKIQVNCTEKWIQFFRSSENETS